MEDKEVLQKAIEIATVKNGSFQYVSVFNEEIETSIGNNQMPIVCYNFPEFKKSIECSKEKLIFSHDFAKAFWGEGYDDEITEMVVFPTGHEEEEYVIKWMYHLQQMVLEENPIDYLRKFIDNTENRK